MVTKTLDSMYKGGVFDHIGFEFARYSTDVKWLVPHFEKMLYDNALLAIAYTEAYAVTGKKLYKEITEKGNFEGKNIPNLIERSLEIIENDKQLKDILKDIQKRLFICREKRVHPHKDDKILTAWNGLMIAALAYGGRVFDNHAYIEGLHHFFKFSYCKRFNMSHKFITQLAICF